MGEIKYRRQKPVPGGRRQLSAGFIAASERAILSEQRRFKVSRAFVIANCVAFALGVEEQETYAPETKSQVRRKLKVVGGRR